MNIFLILLVGVLTILLSYKLFGRWFNHLAIYAFVWTIMLYLYELKLIYFVTLTTYTWLVILGAFISFLIGTITVFSAREKIRPIPESNMKQIIIFSDKGKTLKLFIYVLSIIGILSALQHWQVLLNKYGTVQNVLINAYHVYVERASGELEGVIPYIWLVIYPAIFLAGIYTAYKRKITFVIILPFIALILKEIANLSRAGILFGFSEFIASFMIVRHFINNEGIEKRKINVKMLLGILFLLSILVVGAAFVKSARNATDNFKGMSNSLTKLEGGAFISPSIYFYGASQVAVLNQFLEAEKENPPLGGNTFMIFYRIFARFELVKPPPFRERGYFTPSWSNTGTYLRDIYNDFGYVGILIIPYLLGLLSTFYWIKYLEKGKLSSLIILTHLYVIIIMSFFVYQVKSPRWTVGVVILLIIVPLLEKVKIRKNRYRVY